MTKKKIKKASKSSALKQPEKYLPIPEQDVYYTPLGHDLIRNAHLLPCFQGEAGNRNLRIYQYALTHILTGAKHKNSKYQVALEMSVELNEVFISKHQRELADCSEWSGRTINRAFTAMQLCNVIRKIEVPFLSKKYTFYSFAKRLNGFQEKKLRFSLFFRRSLFLAQKQGEVDSTVHHGVDSTGVTIKDTIVKNTIRETFTSPAENKKSKSSGSTKSASDPIPAEPLNSEGGAAPDGGPPENVDPRDSENVDPIKSILWPSKIKVVVDGIVTSDLSELITATWCTPNPTNDMSLPKIAPEDFEGLLQTCLKFKPEKMRPKTFFKKVHQAIIWMTAQLHEKGSGHLTNFVGYGGTRFFEVEQIWAEIKDERKKSRKPHLTLVRKPKGQATKTQKGSTTQPDNPNLTAREYLERGGASDGLVERFHDAWLIKAPDGVALRWVSEDALKDCLNAFLKTLPPDKPYKPTIKKIHSRIKKMRLHAHKVRQSSEDFADYLGHGAKAFFDGAHENYKKGSTAIINDTKINSGHRLEVKTI